MGKWSVDTHWAQKKDLTVDRIVGEWMYEWIHVGRLTEFPI